MKPVEIYAIICEDGRLFPEENACSDNRGFVEEVLEEIAHSGWECECKDHHIVTYVPKVKWVAT